MQLDEVNIEGVYTQWGCGPRGWAIRGPVRMRASVQLGQTAWTV